jgi:hypothetical protein
MCGPGPRARPLVRTSCTGFKAAPRGPLAPPTRPAQLGFRSRSPPGRPQRRSADAKGRTPGHLVRSPDFCRCEEGSSRSAIVRVVRNLSRVAGFASIGNRRPSEQIR